MPANKKKIRIKSPKNKNTIFGLPAKSYTDIDFWEKECDTVLSNGWLFVGFVHEFNKVGDAQPIFIAGKPILLIKNENSEILLQEDHHLENARSSFENERNFLNK